MNKRYCGRVFTQEELDAIAWLMAQNPQLKRAPLSRRVCEMIDWRRPDGRLSDMSCRVAMLRMQTDGLITLPPSQMPHPRRRAQFDPTPATDAQGAIDMPVHALDALRLEVVAGVGAASRLWNEYVARYHYLGYTPMSGSQIRYNVYAGDRLVALLSFGASAWKLADRERFIGWNHDQRQNNLQRVVNNTRFLILPWVQSKGLASKILALAARRLPKDWQQRYGYSPVMLETFVESPRHKGTCYKAANWVLVGKTTGRGKKSLSHQQALPIKDIWLYPLRPDYAAILRR
ncbi:Druantia anti-phage system protein DruA [Thiomonas sp. FB-Cd]|uniref:Druantia anti-phage system protein DruA n=1 Tax=Thiomonas sp. FB-Cd TaxID=1158292 RepID=UPI0004DF7286|nr:Druantia anti-phage system protein DruA [Thiomonas sp. FB-Cd]